MQFKKSAVVSFLSLLGSLSTALADVRFITSNGVVYSYQVRTSTIKPASTYVETLYYTTTVVEAVTLENNVVTSTTKEAVVTSTVSTTSSLPTTTEDSSKGDATEPSKKPTPASSSPSSSPSSTAAISSTTVSLVDSSDVDSQGKSSGKPSATITSTAAPEDSTSSLVNETTATDGYCEVVYEYTDNDEYYSTVEISGTESVDAATTYTKTRTVYATVSSS